MEVLLVIFGVVVLLLLVAVGVAVWVVKTQQQFVHLDELCCNALSQVGVQLESRWDALSALASLAADYANHERDTLNAIVGQRQSITGGSQPDEVSKQFDLTKQAQRQILAVAEAYPQLRAQEGYLKTMDSVTKFEDTVRMSRMVYNDTITKWNRLVRQFPSNLVGRFLKASERVYLELAGEKREMPTLISGKPPTQD